MDSDSDCKIIGVVRTTPPVNQRLGSFKITLPDYDVPFKSSPSNFIQTMSTGIWDLVSNKCTTPVKFIIYSDLQKGTFSRGWKKVLETNQFIGGNRLTFIVPAQLVSEGENALMYVVKEEGSDSDEE